MPLLKKKALEKKPLPHFLKDDEEVFHCEMTNEIFRDYEEFAERTILCNSMVWTCSMTGKSNLTYQEAVQSEENARKSLQDFPVEMRIPVLFLASKTKRSGFADMSEDVFTYIKERYFVGETVEASFSGVKWGEYHVLQVITPTDGELKCVPKANGNADRAIFPPPHVYKYDLEQLDADDDDVIEKMIVDFTQMRRKKGIFTREKCKLFLKQHVEVNTDGFWCVKRSAMEDFGIDKVKFDNIFAGPLPEFENSKKIIKSVNGKKARQETLAKFLKDGEGKEYKVKAFQDAKKKQEEMRKVRLEQKQKLAEEKQKRKEENIKVAGMLKKWFRPKEDLELEDQKKLPELPPVKTKVLDEHIGEMFMILEFVNSFSKLLRTKDFFPGGFTFDVMERALTEKEVAGPLIDIIQMLLNAIFAQQEEENSHVKINLEEARDRKIISETPTLFECTTFATMACSFPKKYQGLQLDKLPMYSLTVSEILRLHLLSSGARITEPGARWRYQYRGGYTNEDDPGLFMRFNEPHIIRALQYRNIVELSTKNKLKLISCLIDQLLTYADVRDVIDERIENSKQHKIDLRNVQLLEKKRTADVAVAKTRVRGDIQFTPDEIKQKIKKIEQESERQYAEYEKKVDIMSKLDYDYQIVLGYDRAFRRYLKLDSIPGIFVDSYEIYPGICLDDPIQQISELIDADRQIILSHIAKVTEEANTSDKENNPTKIHKINGVNGTTIQEETKLCNDLLICTGRTTTCLVHSQKRNEEPFRFVPTEEKLIQLMEALNKRGIRERELHQALENHKVSTILKSTPRKILNCDIEGSKDLVTKKNKRYDDANLGYPLDADPVIVLHEALVENILEMEEKIFAGNLGTLKIKDRKEWRNYLTIGNYEKFDRTIIKQIENGKISDVKDEHESISSRESTPDIRDLFRDPACTLAKLPLKVGHEDPLEDMDVQLSEKQKEAIECLSIALAQVGHSVEPRYLKKPLGHADYKKGDKVSVKDILENWEKSLLASTSYSQIFLHYGTLDGCIMWSRSVLLARCRVCRRQNDSENMLLCDNCNYGYHLYCLKPKLYTIPQGEWFCPKCLHEKRKQQQLLNPEPKKKKRRIFRDEDIEDEDELIEETEKVGEEDKDRESGSDDNEGEGDCELCITCGSGGELVSCEKCPKSYHVECIEPPLRRIPRGAWMCNGCKGKRERNTYRDTDSDSEYDDVSSATRRTSRREAEDLPLHNVGLQDLLTEIMRHKDAWPFVRPVQKNEVPDYYDVISNPMDFGTIKYKLNMGKYTCDEEFMADSVLVFANCNTYNDTDADVYKCGVRLLKVFRKKCKELGLRMPEEMEDENEEQMSPPKNKKRRIK